MSRDFKFILLMFLLYSSFFVLIIVLILEFARFSNAKVVGSTLINGLKFFRTTESGHKVSLAMVKTAYS